MLSRSITSRIQKRTLITTITKTPFTDSASIKHVKQPQELTTTDLLTKLGYVKQPNAGLTHYLPLGLQTLRNIENIIHFRLKEVGCIETSLSSISHSSLWEKTNRWNNDELFKLSSSSATGTENKKKKDDEFCLAATAEEEITELVKSYAETYRKLPIRVYQMTRKYRNEKRPRGGLLRGREFIMKDAYTFDISSNDALISFELLNEVYFNIFKDLKLNFIKANADSGSIGGDLSYEWHFESEKGEDTLYVCDHCNVASNIEKIHPLRSDDRVDEAEARHFLSLEGDLVVVYVPKGRSVNLKFIESEDLVDLNEKLVDNDDKVIDIFTKNENEFKNVIRLIDKQVKPGTLMPDLPVVYSRARMTTFEDLDIVEAEKGDTCKSCGEGHLLEKQGIEVGHTFYLGTKYSEPLDAKFMDQDGIKKFYEMGCYGIGVSRLIGAIAEITRDEVGLRWPARIAPLQVTIVKLYEGQDEKYVEFIRKMKDNKDILCELDDSDSGLGVKLNKSKKLGIPLQAIIGKSFPKVEIEVRGKRYGNDEFEYLKKFEENKKEWDWEVTEVKGIEKHMVDIKYADQVIQLLLKDM